MTKIGLKSKRLWPISRNPYVRRDESEMERITSEINNGVIGIRAACLKYGLCRNTLRRWITRFSVRKLESIMSKKQNKIIPDYDDSKALQRKVYELTRALEDAKQKICSLETLIKVSEENFQIKFRKKPGTKQSKE